MILLLKIAGALFILAICFVIYVIIGIKYLEETNQAREDAKNKRNMV